MVTSTARVLGARSSLLNHEFPTFYACYLLKSIQLPLSSKATYIGSTPNPPRRIRQHNGELQAGARKTASKRPWVMQMIIHGFPSRLAALQFEWAWQNPHKSRHLRDEDGRIFGNRGTKRIEKLIHIVRTMITRPPYNTWPLHVKLFTEEAVKIWEAASAAKHVATMPPGFTYSIELEGVDGKSGHPGSGRKGPIDVEDVDFTNAHLAKHTSLLATRRRLECNICHKPIHGYATVPLETSLCPSLHCTAVSHLSCLSQHFLISETAKMQKQNKSEFIPRGGNCKTCGNYILWGDVIRGSYRRFRSMQKTQDGADNTVEDDLFMSDEDEMNETDENGIEETPTKTSVKRQTRNRSTSSSARKKSVHRKTTKRVSSRTRSSSGESFDFDNISSSSDGETFMEQKRGRPQTSSSLVSPGSKDQSAKAKSIQSVRRAPGRPRKGLSTPTGIHSRIEDAVEALNSNSDTGDSPKRMGRPKSKDLPSSRLPLPIVSPMSSSKNPRKGKEKASDTQETFTMDDIRAALAIIEAQSKGKTGPPSGSYSSTCSHIDDVGNSLKRQRGRPRKLSILPSSVFSPISSSAEEPARRKPGRPRKTRSSSLSEVSSVTSQPTRGSRNVNLFSNDIENSGISTRQRGKPRIDSKQTEASHNDISTSCSEKDRRQGRGKLKQILSPTGKASSIGTLPEASKHGRPRKEASPALGNAAFPEISIPSRGLRGRPRQKQVPEAPLVISSGPSTPEVIKRSRGRPCSVPSLSSTPKRGRPRKTDLSPPSSNKIVTTSGPGPDKRKPGRPRKEKSPLSSVNDNVPIKQKSGRARKDVGLIPPTSSIKSQTTVFSSKKGIHSQSIQNDSSSGETFDFAGLSDSEASDDDFDQFLARIATRLKGQKVSHPSEPSRKPSRKLDNALEVCNLRQAPNVGGAKDLPIVIISD